MESNDRTKEVCVKFMALIYGDQDVWDTFSDEQKEAAYVLYRSFAEDARKADALLGGDELASPRTATTVRVRGGETLVTDGPYTEVKEALGGYFVLECDSLDDALDLAARIPGARHGAVEVRPVYVDPAEVQL
jgi:hypothetical protein